MKDIAGEDRHEHGILEAENAHKAHQQERGADRTVAHREAESLNEVLQRRTFTRAGLELFEPHHQQRNNHGQKTDAIQEKTPALADPSDGEACNGGTHDPCAIKDG